MCFSAEPNTPMIPLGLKETKEIDFREPFKVSLGQARPAGATSLFGKFMHGRGGGRADGAGRGGPADTVFRFACISPNGF